MLKSSVTGSTYGQFSLHPLLVVSGTQCNYCVPSFRFDLNKIEMQDVMEVIPSILNPSQIMVSPDMPQPHPSMDTCPYPVNSDENQCDVHSRYRTADGSCNNLHHPLWGKSFMALHRFLPPDYADGNFY